MSEIRKTCYTVAVLGAVTLMAIGYKATAAPANRQCPDDARYVNLTVTGSQKQDTMFPGPARLTNFVIQGCIQR